MVISHDVLRKNWTLHIPLIDLTQYWWIGVRNDSSDQIILACCINWNIFWLSMTSFTESFIRYNTVHCKKMRGKYSNGDYFKCSLLSRTPNYAFRHSVIQFYKKFIRTGLDFLTFSFWCLEPNLRRFRVMHRFAPPIRY